MNWKYELHENYSENQVCLESTKGYKLILNSNRIEEGFLIHFKSSALRKIGDIPITSRNFEEYRNIYEENWGLMAVDFSPKFQYVEIGAGLGEFIPAIIRKFPNLSHKPIIIDPANYELMLDMMKEARSRLELGRGFSKRITNCLKEKLEERIQRAEIISNPNKVRLINMKLGEAIIKYPEIIGIGDLVVEQFGPCTYSETESPFYGIKKVIDMDKRLVKKGGIFILNGEIIED